MSGPVIREAMKLGIPSLIHEQNAFPGVTNKALSKKAAYNIAQNLPNALSGFYSLSFSH